MKRSSVVSTLVLTGLAIAMAGSFAGAVRATQKTHGPCLKGCGPKQTPAADDCCKPPPCELLYELRSARALHRSVARGGQQLPGGKFAAAQALAAAGLGPLASPLNRATYKNMEDFLDLKRQALKVEAPKYAHCNAKTNHVPQEPFKVDGGCNISTSGGSILETVDDAKKASSGCDEVTEANFRSAETEQAHCRAVQREREMLANEGRRQMPVTASELMDLARQMSDKKVESLEKALFQFWKSCSDNPDPEAQASAKTALDELMKGGKANADRFFRAAVATVGGQP